MVSFSQGWVRLLVVAKGGVPKGKVMFLWEYEFEKAQKLGFHSPNREGLGAWAEGQSPGFKTERLNSCGGSTAVIGTLIACVPL